MPAETLPPTAREPGRRRLAAVLITLAAPFGAAAAAASTPTPAAATPPTAAAEVPVVAAPLLAGERIVLDGSLSHPAWQRAPAHERFVENAPRNGAAPPQRTRVQVLFDALAVYIGVTAFDDQPQAIRAVPVRHDAVNRTQDFVVAYLDPIGHQAAAQFFRVNAAGSMADGIHTAADDSEDFSPDFDWDAAVQRRDDGWTAVLRIPFASLRYAQPAAGQAALPWRFMLGRRLPREQFHWVTSVDLPRGAPHLLHRLQPLQGVTLPPDPRFLALRPTLTLRQARASGGAEPPRRTTHHEAGLDLKWRPRAELVVDATLNPDFSQLALDVPQLAGNSRFALFLPEKRPFFFESADLLRTPTEALYTRSITQPRAGLRATWRSPAWQGTVIAADDAGGGAVLLPGPWGTGVAAQDGSRVLAARVRREGGSGGTALGALMAVRRYEAGRGDNLVVGADLEASPAPHWRLRSQLLASRTTALDDGRGELREGPARDGQRLVARLERETEASRTELSVDTISPHFRHDTGFVNQAGIRSAGLHQSWTWHALGPFNSLEAYVDARDVRDPDGRLQDRWAYAGIWTTAARNLEWWLELHPRSTVHTRQGSALLVQRFASSGLVMTPGTWWTLLEANVSAGQLADQVADRARPGANGRVAARLRPVRALELELALSRAQLRDDGPAAATAYRESAAQLLGVWHLGARSHLRLIAQRQQLQRRAEPGVAAHDDASRSTSLSWHWRPDAGTQVVIGATRQRDADPRGARLTEAYAKFQVDPSQWRLPW